MKLQVFQTIAVGFCLMIPLMVSAEDTICIQTGDVSNGGTNEDVHYMLFGDQGQTDWIELDAPFVDDFERGNNDCFPLEGGSTVGNTIVKLGIQFEGSYFFRDDWYLDSATVNFKGNCFKFAFKEWMTRENTRDYHIALDC